MPIPERVWVPRRLYVSDDGELKLGRGAGQLFDLPGLPVGTIGRRQRLLDARHTLWVVERQALDEKLIEDYALVLPERLIDADVQPHAHRWLAHLPLVCISGIKSERIVREDRLRVYRVAVDERRGVLMFEVDASGGGKSPWSFGARAAELEAGGWGGEECESRLGLEPPSSMVDRLLRHLSGGVLDEESLVAALQAVTLVEPGCGYRGATDGVPATIEEVQFGARAVEAVFAQVDRRAEGQVAYADAIVAELSMARGEEKTSPTLPIYGEVQRVWDAERTLDLRAVNASYSSNGTELDVLALPREVRFFIGECDRWQPRIPAELARELASVLRKRQPPPQWVALLMVALLIGLITVSFVLRR